MRKLLTGLAVVMSFGAVAGPATIDLHGTAWSGPRSEPNAVIWLEVPDARPAPQTEEVVLDQRNLSFSPHVLAVQVGTVVEFPNNDRVLHNVFLFRDGKRFDLGLYPVGTTRRVTFDRPAVSRLFCNIHPNMAAYILAVDSPYFSVVDQRGAFTIPSVPTGSYTYNAWRPGGPTLTGTVTLDGEKPLEVRWP
jgi:plastocyanin